MAHKNTAAVPLKGAHIMVIGGAGLVGVATVEELMESGVEKITVFDNLAFGGQDSIERMQPYPQVRVIHGDILKLHDLLAATAEVEGIIHLAAYGALDFNRDLWTGIDVNVRGVQNVLEACRVNRVRKLIFSSCEAVYGYGPNLRGALVEDTPFYTASAPPAAVLYGASKIMGEQFCRDAFRKYGQDYVILRYSTVYGERQRDSVASKREIVEAHDAIRRNESPKVAADGSETKHFVEASDLARANCMALESTATDIALNISGPSPTTMHEVVAAVVHVCDRYDLMPELLKPTWSRADLASKRKFEIVHTAATDAIGWKPRATLHNGLRRALAWRDYLARNPSD